MLTEHYFHYQCKLQCSKVHKSIIYVCICMYVCVCMYIWLCGVGDVGGDKVSNVSQVNRS